MSESDRHLKPDEAVQKVLISTTSRMVGEYDSDGLVITHAWPSFHNRNASFIMRMEETPISRSGYIIAREAPPIQREPSAIVPDYSVTAEGICGFLSVLFGKRFDCHGYSEEGGLYQIPNFNAYSTICNPRLPFNSHQPRACLPVPLELGQFTSIDRILVDPAIGHRTRTRLTTACSFYMQALQDVEHNTEIAYLHLITAGEILSSFFSYPRKDILDRQTIDDLNTIEQEIEGGGRMANRIGGRLRSIRKTFVKSMCSLLDDQFFATNDSIRSYACFEADDIENRVGAAYDLRSRYVHTGTPFGHWVEPSTEYTDTQVGAPIVGDRKLEIVLEMAPKFGGLERLTRYCILKYMQSEGIFVIQREPETQESTKTG